MRRSDWLVYIMFFNHWTAVVFIVVTPERGKGQVTIRLHPSVLRLKIKWSRRAAGLAANFPRVLFGASLLPSFNLMEVWGVC